MRLFRLFPRTLGVASLVSLPMSSVARADPANTDPPKENEGGHHFAIDPVADGVVIATGAGFSALLGVVLGSGEIKPLLAGSANVLPSIDRIAVTQTIDPSAGTYSDIGLYAATGFAVLDSGWTGLHSGWTAAGVDALMYGEALSLSLAFTDIVKIAVRRPRPIDYSPQNQSNTTNTDLALSFFSGHVAAVSAISATATYLAFVHSPHSPRPWITLGAGALLTRSSATSGSGRDSTFRRTS